MAKLPKLRKVTRWERIKSRIWHLYYDFFPSEQMKREKRISKEVHEYIKNLNK